MASLTASVEAFEALLSPPTDGEGEVWRPVQYLGSKLRSLPQILTESRALANGGGFWDVFTGSSVVAQGAAASGYSVYATDTQVSSVSFASALLHIGRRPNDASQLRDALGRALAAPHPDLNLWASWLSKEDRLVHEGDYRGLTELYQILPQRWKCASTEADWNSETPLTTTYSGTYLSLRQAMELDAARLHVTEQSLAEGMSEWMAHAIITALSHGASAAVHSAGKHFAQPLRPATVGAENFAFISKRAIQDRSISISAVAHTAVRGINRERGAALHSAECSDALAVTATQLREKDISVVYADPPYTAQQYSRFYHLLETLADGKATTMQRVRGSVSKGLYPEDRYSSPFCSRRKVAGAFQTLVGTAHEAGASLVLSYSATGESSGNQRTISLSNLCEIVSDHYGSGNLSLSELSHGYRQFNAVTRRDDAMVTGEVLIVAEAK